MIHLIGDSLILMGETGMNEYINALEDGKSIDEVETYVPFVVEAIISAVNELIELGAKTILVPGGLPMGCFPMILKLDYGYDKTKYDNITGCLFQFNKIAEYHNELLMKELNKIRELYPEANLLYADIYNAAMQFYRSPKKYGFTNEVSKACYDFTWVLRYNDSVSWWDLSPTLCDNPDTYISWDGTHLTEAAYKIISKSLLQGPYTVPQFYSSCLLKEMDVLSSFM
uniref:SGNH hydrolase-type esterase domain-containing protein n=1 Tax=Lactuca sativa TaxID=4236 RepID=A0A9R1VP85_LACSA|nr:hypothetical protein LSAT_V11C400176680 [Lactuca sativa]